MRNYIFVINPYCFRSVKLVPFLRNPFLILSIFPLMELAQSLIRLQTGVYLLKILTFMNQFSTTVFIIFLIYQLFFLIGRNNVSSVFCSFIKRVQCSLLSCQVLSRILRVCKGMSVISSVITRFRKSTGTPTLSLCESLSYAPIWICKKRPFCDRRAC